MGTVMGRNSLKPNLLSFGSLQQPGSRFRLDERPVTSSEPEEDKVLALVKSCSGLVAAKGDIHTGVDQNVSK